MERRAKRGRDDWGEDEEAARLLAALRLDSESAVDSERFQATAQEKEKEEKRQPHPSDKRTQTQRGIGATSSSSFTSFGCCSSNSSPFANATSASSSSSSSSLLFGSPSPSAAPSPTCSSSFSFGSSSTSPSSLSTAASSNATFGGASAHSASAAVGKREAMAAEETRPKLGPVATFKLLLVGDGGVGKTTYVKRHRTGEFEKKYVATLGVEVHPLTFYTNMGTVQFNVWDCAGQERYGGLRDGYYIMANAAILMFDVTSRVTYKNISNWYRDILRVCENIPMVLVGNKVDCGAPDPTWAMRKEEREQALQEAEKSGVTLPREPIDHQTKAPIISSRQVMPKHITFHRKQNLQYYDISAKSNYNFEKPFQWLARRLLNNPDLAFVDAPPLAPMTVQLSSEKVKQYEAELAALANAPLPDDDDDF
eukprot:TRINITY_DN3968_c2_g1_i1.p1 TRINITY_DN3968_c2_g1~~TRINITY_DN3968_c2_g1_i1.p1  ORF type:complete len:424 (+),score=108.79 TRINITY_DN3968_c2_g1_i1:50-1321(+)